jgi:hypothetical protein
MVVVLALTRTGTHIGRHGGALTAIRRNQGVQGVVQFVLAVLALVILTGGMLFLYLRVLTGEGRSRLWPSGEPAWYAKAPPWWRYGDVAWRGYARALAFGGVIGGTFLVLALWCFMLLTSLGSFEFVSDKSARDWLGWGLTVGFAGLIASAIVSMSIVLTNRPRMLVPPGLRDQPGAIDEWSHRRRYPRGRHPGS